MLTRLTFLLLTVLLFNFNIYSAWFTQNSGVSSTLSSVYFTSPNVGYAAGDNGVILKTVDKGASWSRLNTGVNNNLYSVRFINIQKGFACGDNIILKTVDGGLTWQSYTNGISSSLKSIYMLDENTAYAVGYGGLIFKTVNGGAEWNIILSSENSGFTSIYFLNSNTGYVTGIAGKYLKTIDGGLTWNAKPTDASKNFYSVQFLNQNVGYITGGWVNSTVMKSVNGGESWDNLFSGATGVRLFSGSFIDEYNGYVCGRYGTIMKTIDAGGTWAAENSGVSSALNSIQYLNQNTAYAVGENGKIISTISVIGINQISSNIPDKFSLEQNYPNPFNPMTNVRFQISNGGFVKLVVFDMLGREASVLVNEELYPGTYEVNFDASNLSSGAYFYSLSAGEYSETKKMLMVK